MNIKSKKWYENQIKALENAAKNIGRLIYQPIWYEYGSKKYEEEMEFAMKENIPIHNACKKIYDQLNKLKDEYNLYYR
jgi:hypothetical protein